MKKLFTFVFVHLLLFLSYKKVLSCYASSIIAFEIVYIFAVKKVGRIVAGAVKEISGGKN